QALAVLWYLENRDPDWKNSGIKDEDITMVNSWPAEGAAEEEVQRVRDLKVSLLLNIGRSYYLLLDFGVSCQACSLALEVDPHCAKALYRRAQAVVAPASAGGYEVEEAIRDLTRAAELVPGNASVTRLRRKLRWEQRSQRERDRSMFEGMFRRGTVCDGR
ncbi:unnamed protein product, partial [Discosporangium mesarthrocarpum]